MAGGSCAVGGLALARWGHPRFCLGGGELGAAVGGAASLPAHGAGAADVVRETWARISQEPSGGVEAGTVTSCKRVVIFNHCSPATTALLRTFSLLNLLYSHTVVLALE